MTHLEHPSDAHDCHSSHSEISQDCQADSHSNALGEIDASTSEIPPEWEWIMARFTKVV